MDGGEESCEGGAQQVVDTSHVLTVGVTRASHVSQASGMQGEVPKWDVLVMSCPVWAVLSMVLCVPDQAGLLDHGCDPSTAWCIGQCRHGPFR